MVRRNRERGGGVRARIGQLIQPQLAVRQMRE
jgi:hypothetical protein